MKKAKCFNFIVSFFPWTIIVLKYDRHPNKHTANKYLLKCQLSLPGFFLLATGCCGQTADPEATNPKRGEGRGGDLESLLRPSIMRHCGGGADYSALDQYRLRGERTDSDLETGSISTERYDLHKSPVLRIWIRRIRIKRNGSRSNKNHWKQKISPN